MHVWVVWGQLEHDDGHAVACFARAEDAQAFIKDSPNRWPYQYSDFYEIIALPVTEPGAQPIRIDSESDDVVF